LTLAKACASGRRLRRGAWPNLNWLADNPGQRSTPRAAAWKSIRSATYRGKF
jgi:hypothetical protein